MTAPVQLPADLHQRLETALRTTPATGWVHLPSEERFDHHLPDGGHRYAITCALCRNDVDALTAALAAALQPELAELAALREQLAAAQTENARLRAELAEARGHAELYGRKLVAALAARNES